MNMDERVGYRRFVARMAACALVALTLAVTALAQEGDAEPVAASSGVYLEEQAVLGAAVFAQRCAGCHGAELAGGFGPRLAPLASFWHGRSLSELYSFVAQNMPFDAPGSLSAAEYAQVVAFVLERNGYPAGAAELLPDAQELSRFVIDAPASE